MRPDPLWRLGDVVESIRSAQPAYTAGKS